MFPYDVAETSPYIFLQVSASNLRLCHLGGTANRDFWGMLPSGKRLHNELENHHAIHGEIHYFYGDFP